MDQAAILRRYEIINEVALLENSNLSNVLEAEKGLMTEALKTEGNLLNEAMKT